MPTTWSKDDWSCLKTWGVLVALGQLENQFQESGAIKVSQLRFWQASEASLQKPAARKQLAQGIDRIFVSPLIKAARIAPMPKAIEELAQVLAVGTNSVATIAATVDQLYDSESDLFSPDVDLRDEDDELELELDEEEDGGGSVDH